MSPSTRPAFLLRRASEVAVLLSVFCISSLAAAAPLPPSTGSLLPSTFQGGDGNQTDSASLTDWQGLAAANRVNHSPDPSAQDTAFVGGSSEDQPVLWDLTTEPGGVNPAKSNILDAWEVSDPLGGDVFVYLAFARESAQLLARAGTTYLTFELNHDARLWNNGRADIPCRTTGDVLVSYQATGNDVSVILQRWVTNTWDDASGCARTGHLEDYAAFTPNVDAQGAVNEPDIATYLPGFYQRHDSFRALRRGLAEPEPADDGGLRQALLLLRVDLDALTVLAIGVGEHAGLPRSEAARSTNVLRVGDEVPRRQRQRPTRRGRAWPAALDDLGRLRRRRRSRRQRAVRATPTTRVST